MLAAPRAAAQEVQLVVSLAERRLWAVRGADTLLDAAVAVGSGRTLAYGGRRWRFATPRGAHTVVRRDSNPVWVPPDWHYYEVARARGWAVRRVDPARPTPLGGGAFLAVRGGVVGTLDGSGAFAPLPADEEIAFGGVLYIPPEGTRQRAIAGQLGRFRLVLGDGYAIHGTPAEDSLGQAVTHGCIRVGDAELEWLWAHVPLGTRVWVY